MKNYLEYLKQKERNEIKGQLFALKKFEKEKNLKFAISELNPKEELSRIILEGKPDITAAINYDDYLITGDIIGNINIYSLKEQNLIYTFNCPLKMKINALDIDDDADYIFAGYSNGNIGVYNLESNKSKLINISETTKSLINMKIVDRIDNKTFRIFSSDEEGNVFSIIINFHKFALSRTKAETICEKEKYPTFLIYPLKVNEKKIKNKNFIKNLNKYVVLGNLLNVTIYSLEPKISEIVTFEKPDYIKYCSIPDISVGLYNESSELKDDKLCLLFAVSWDKVIKLYTIPILEEKMGNPELLGHYINDMDIVRIGILNENKIFLVDKSGNFKLLNIKKFVLDDPQLDIDFSTPQISKVDYQCELQNTLNFDGAISRQMILNSGKDEIIVFTNKKIYNPKIFNYQYYFKKYLKNEEKWLELLVFGINIYQGRILSFMGIPLNTSERKKVIGEFLRDFISQYLFVNIENRHTLQSDKIEKMMEIIIEFCIEIESVNYLLNDILKVFEAINYKDLFLKKLEPFILCDKLLKYEIQDEVILSIISIYDDNKDLNTLEKLLLHINVKSLDAPSVIEELTSLNLLSILLYMYTNDIELDLKTIKKIFDNINDKDDYKEFKKFLINMPKSFKMEINVLNTYNQFFPKSCFNSIKKLEHMNCLGNMITLDKCDICHKSLEQTLSPKEKIIIFCKHKVHKYCFSKEIDYFKGNSCFLCSKKENATSDSINKNSNVSSNKSLQKKSKDEKVQKNMEDNNINSFNPKRAFKRMKAYDKLRIKEKKSLYYNISNSLRDEYRKKAFSD